MNCIDVSEANYDQFASEYRNYKKVEFSYKRIKFAYADGRVDHHMLLISYVVGKGFFGEKWQHTLYDNYEIHHFSKYDAIDDFIRSKYAEYNPLGSVELFTEPFYRGANFWERFSGQDANW